MVRCSSLAGEEHLALVGDDLEVAEHQRGVAGLRGPGPAEQRPDAGRQLLRGEGLGEVVVGAGLEPGHDVVGVGAGRHHHDRHVAGAPQRAAQLEAVDARQHDVDEHDVGRLAVEGVDRLLAAAGLLDRPALVLEGHLDSGADPLVVLDGQDASAHSHHRAASSTVRMCAYAPARGCGGTSMGRPAVAVGPSPSDILAQAPESPWGFLPGMFDVDHDEAPLDLPSRRLALDALARGARCSTSAAGAGRRRWRWCRRRRRSSASTSARTR